MAVICDVIIEDDRWHGAGLQALAEKAIAATLARFHLPTDCEVSVLGCDDARIAVLNAGFRGKNTPTNVLSWPAQNLPPVSDGATPPTPQPEITGELALGDIALAWETCAREASEAGKPLADHITHLVVHGTLHLLGYDHIRDADATLMERREVEILGILGVDDPYSGADGA